MPNQSVLLANNAGVFLSHYGFSPSTNFQESFQIIMKKLGYLMASEILLMSLSIMTTLHGQQQQMVMGHFCHSIVL